MKKVIALGVAAAGLSLLAAAPSNASEVCYDVNVNVNGTPLVQAGCQDLPELPALPEAP